MFISSVKMPKSVIKCILQLKTRKNVPRSQNNCFELEMFKVYNAVLNTAKSYACVFHHFFLLIMLFFCEWSSAEKLIV